MNSKRGYEEWSIITFLSWSDFFEKSISSLLLRLAKIVLNIVPLADKIDTDKDIGHVPFTEAVAIYCDRY